MRSVEDYRRILQLWQEGYSKKAIARCTAIPRRTVTECIQRFGSPNNLENHFSVQGPSSSADAEHVVQWLEDQTAVIHESYAYLLGLYLGDGCISRSNRVYRLRLSLDARYPGIIAQAVQALRGIFPTRKTGIVQQPGCVHVSCYYKHWPELFPQHGKGPKHKRPITLTGWQQRIVTAYPLELLRGLYHSDGSRSSNVIKGKNYPRYLFANESDGIRRIYCEACNRLNLHWTVANRRNICISRRQDVAYMDQVIGPKN